MKGKRGKEGKRGKGGDMIFSHPSFVLLSLSSFFSLSLSFSLSHKEINMIFHQLEKNIYKNSGRGRGEGGRLTTPLTSFPSPFSPHFSHHLPITSLHFPPLLHHLPLTSPSLPLTYNLSPSIHSLILPSFLNFPLFFPFPLSPPLFP